jgi:hypothetical protein
MIRIKYLQIATLVLAASVPCARAQTANQSEDAESREANLSAYVALMRSDIRAQKVAIITDLMRFTEEEDAKFWPVYRDYETALAKINDDRIALIKQYADSYTSLTDATADDIATRALGLDARRHALIVEYYDRFKKVVAPKTAARYLQVERQILLLLDLQIAANLPAAAK